MIPNNLVTSANELPGYRIGSNVLRFSADELAAWLEARRSNP